MIADGWYPAISPSALYIACGSATISLARINIVNDAVVLTDETQVGDGVAPRWWNPAGAPSDQLLFFDRHASLLIVPTPPPFVPQFLTHQGFNEYDAGGGTWAGWVDPGRVISRSDGVAIPDGGDVARDQAGRFAYLSQDNTRLHLDGGLLETGVIASPQMTTQALLWQRYVGPSLTETRGIRPGGGIERVQASTGNEFARPIDTPEGPWILAHDQSRLYLRPWGSLTVQVVATGVLNVPHGIYSATLGGFLVAWSDEAARLQVRFIPSDATGVAPGGGGTGTVGVPPPIVDSTNIAALTATRPAKVIVAPRAVYPHVPQITDPHAQQSTKLLWDKVFELSDRLDRGDIAGKFSAVGARIDATNSTVASQQNAIIGDPAESQATSIPGSGSGGSPGGGGTGGGGSGTSSSCADSPGTGHFDPGGALTEERARKIACGTSDEWSALRAPTADLATRETNAEQLLRRIIWHLAQGGYTVGRQRNPSLAISKDKIAITFDLDSVAIDLFSNFDGYTSTMVSQWVEVGAGNYVADAGIPD